VKEVSIGGKKINENTTDNNISGITLFLTFGHKPIFINIKTD